MKPQAKLHWHQVTRNGKTFLQRIRSYKDTGLSKSVTKPAPKTGGGGGGPSREQRHVAVHEKRLEQLHGQVLNVRKKCADRLTRARESAMKKISNLRSQQRSTTDTAKHAKIEHKIKQTKAQLERKTQKLTDRAQRSVDVIRERLKRRQKRLEEARRLVAKKHGREAAKPVPKPVPGTKLSASVHNMSRQTAVHETLNMIDSIHSVGPVHGRITIGDTKLSSHTMGTYQMGRGHVNIGTAEQHAAGRHLTTAHELGHALDHRMFGDGSMISDKEDFSSFGRQKHRPNPEMQAVMHSIHQTEAVRHLAGAEKNKYNRYLMEPHELFARAYSQYIVTKANHQPSLDHITDLRRRESRTPSGGNRQWSHDDFKSVIPHFDKLFEKYTK